MKGNGTVEGKGWMALYITPKLVKSAVRVLLFAMIVMLIVTAANMMSVTGAELDEAIAAGLVPECVKNYMASIAALLVGAILMIYWMVRK